MLLSHGAFCLLLLGASPVLAQAPQPLPAEASVPEGALFPQTPDAPEAPPQPISGTRLMLELLGGAAGGTVGGVIPWLFVSAVERDMPELLDSPRTVIDVASFVTLGLGSSLGVYGLGRLAGGHGRYAPTLLGSAIGTALSAIPFISSGGSAGIALLTLASATVGGIVGYELSQAAGAPRAGEPPLARNNFRWRPVVATTLRGGFVGGLVGTF